MVWNVVYYVVLLAGYTVQGVPDLHKRQSPGCGVPSQLSQEMKDQLLQEHNEWRKVQGASNMWKMVWSTDLASRAQEWAEECQWNHGMTKDCYDTPIGQNLHMLGGGQTIPPVAMAVKDAINIFINEKESYNYTANSCSHICGHYLQMVWSESYELGCGVAACPETSSKITDENGETSIIPTMSNVMLIVCNYRKGKHPNVVPFKEGAACSDCGAEAPYKCLDKLCTDCDFDKDEDCVCPVCSGSNVLPDFACTDWADYCVDPEYKYWMELNCYATCCSYSLPEQCQTPVPDIV